MLSSSVILIYSNNNEHVAQNLPGPSRIIVMIIIKYRPNLLRLKFLVLLYKLPPLFPLLRILKIAALYINIY